MKVEVVPGSETDIARGSAPFQALVSRTFLLGMSLFYISPVYWMFVTALKSHKELANFPPTFWPKEIVWQNFDQATN